MYIFKGRKFLCGVSKGACIFSFSKVLCGLNVQSHPKKKEEQEGYICGRYRSHLGVLQGAHDFIVLENFSSTNIFYN